MGNRPSVGSEVGSSLDGEPEPTSHQRQGEGGGCAAAPQRDTDSPYGEKMGRS
jgi:hypothetical protein